jgi:hypothetical protein
MHGDNAEREHLIQQKQRLPSHASGAAEGKAARSQTQTTETRSAPQR